MRLFYARSLSAGLRRPCAGARRVCPVWGLPCRCAHAAVHCIERHDRSGNNDGKTSEETHTECDDSTTTPAAGTSSRETFQAEMEDMKRSTALHASRAHETMERAAAARHAIYEMWRHVANAEATPTTASADTFRRDKVDGDAKEKAQSVGRPVSFDAERLARLAALLQSYRIDPSTPREEDVCRGLGDALDRLILMCVPLPLTGSTEMLEAVLHVAARQGRQLSVRTVQHLFARTSGYAEALAVFYALRRCNFAMNMEAYHAMLYSLQRLEEEGWAQRFHEEYTAQPTAPRVSEQALDFILRGVDNQLLPENKPWLGRIMFADTNNAAAARRSQQDFDEHGKLWVKRYRSSESVDV